MLLFHLFCMVHIGAGGASIFKKQKEIQTVVIQLKPYVIFLWTYMVGCRAEPVGRAGVAQSAPAVHRPGGLYAGAGDLFFAVQGRFFQKCPAAILPRPAYHRAEE